MADKVIHVNVTSTKSQRVSVSPGNVQNEITATPDSSQYYSNLAKNWAIGAGLILNEDYSSKHYAKESANSASSAKNYADASQTTYTNVQNVANEALTDIETARVDAVGNITTVKSESIASVEAKGNEVVSTVNAGIANIEAKGNEASTLVNTGIANINTAKTEAVNAVTTTKNNAVTEINKEVTDGKKELNDIIEAGGLNINDKLTNCLLEVPQNIKLELADGKLTLKAGSKVIVPNGAGVFEEIVITSDKARTISKIEETFLYYKDGVLGERSVNNSTSGATQPTQTSGLWYDTTNNIVKSSTGGDFTGGCSLPIARIANGVINQVFNGMGYIGSTVWVDKGVKGLKPNGRNADGTLNNTEIINTYVRTRTLSTTGSGDWYVAFNPNITWTQVATYNYDEEKNITSTDGNDWAVCVLGRMQFTNGKITSFQPKLPVRLLTYDDIKINNPYFFGQYIWSEFAPDNLSWLKSSGQWNSGSGYQSFYDWALANANANKAGFKLSTASYTDYDFVVNTSAKTFRLPVKVQNTPLNDSASVVGNGLALGLNSGTVNFGMVLDNGSSHNYEIFKTGAYGASTQGTAYGNTVATPADYPIGVTTDSTKSGLVANLSANTNVSLYFYVGETTRDTGLINASQIASNFADKIGRTECKAYITETYRSGTSWYRVYSDGWCEQGGHIASGTTAGVVALLKPYASTNYDVIVAPSSTGDYFTVNIAGWADSKTQFGWNSYNNSATPKIWRTYGYIN